MTGSLRFGGLLGRRFGRGVCAAGGRAAAGPAWFAVTGRLATADRGWRLARLSASPGRTFVRDDLSALAESAGGRPSRWRLLRVAGRRRRSSLWVTRGLGQGLARHSGAESAAYEHWRKHSKE